MQCKPSMAAAAPGAGNRLACAERPRNLETEPLFERQMRRIPIRLGLIVLLAAGMTSCNRATKPGGSGGAAITNVRIGIPPGPLAGDEDAGRRAPMFKAGHWTPILVTIEGREDLENAELVVQALDSDDVLNEISTPLG